MFRQIERRKILRSLSVSTILATARRVWVVDISSIRPRQEVRHVGTASLTGRRVKDSIFFLCAFHLDIPDGEDEQTTHEVVERVEVVHYGSADILKVYRAHTPVTYSSAQDPNGWQNLRQNAVIAWYGTNTPENDTKTPMSRGLTRAAKTALGAYAATN